MPSYFHPRFSCSADQVESLLACMCVCARWQGDGRSDSSTPEVGPGSFAFPLPDKAEAQGLRWDLVVLPDPPPPRVFESSWRRKAVAFLGVAFLFQRRICREMRRRVSCGLWAKKTNMWDCFEQMCCRKWLAMRIFCCAGRLRSYLSETHPQRVWNYCLGACFYKRWKVAKEFGNGRLFWLMYSILPLQWKCRKI